MGRFLILLLLLYILCLAVQNFMQRLRAATGSVALRPQAPAARSAAASPSPEILLANVALPIPLPDPLTYEIPPAWASQAVPGVRTRVTMGRRRLTGVIVGVHQRRPEGVAVRPIEEVLDREPVLTADLLELARFVADYYLAPLGEVVRSMLPSDLPPW